MCSTVRQIYKNPHCYGHIFLQPADTVLQHISKAIEALQKEDRMQDKRRSALAPLAEGPVELSLGQVVAFEIQ